MLKRILRPVKRYFRHTDALMLFLIVCICAFSLVLTFSTTRSYGSNKYIVIQAGAMLIGFVGYIIASLLDLERFPRLWILLFVFNILFQVSLRFFGVAGDTGNRSWIRFGPIGVQPGEIGKIIFIYTMACHISLLRDRLNSVFSVAQLLLHTLVTTGAVYFFSKDLGVTIMYPLIFVIMFFAGGAALPLLWSKMSENQRFRILVVFEPELSSRFAWHAQQSMQALRGGGLFGQGLLRGAKVQSSTLYGKHTDFIFSSCGEELGFVGCALLLLLLAALVMRVLHISGKSAGTFDRLMCAGVGGMMTVQILINIGMCAGVMPVIGLTLPLVSYGGSSIVTTLTALGFVCGAAMRQKPSWLRN